MRHVSFDPESLPVDLKAEWDDLQERASAGTDAIIEKWESHRKVTGDDFNSTIWGDVKQFLMKHVFHNKCAYCETNLAEARQDADAEHFRPKSGVNFKEKPEAGNRTYTKATVSDVSQNPAEDIVHPGYFWLAYNWKNLLPACRHCNSKDGKKSQFPVAENKHAFLVRMTDAEVAALISRSQKSKKWPGIHYLDFDDLDQIEVRYLLHPYWDEEPEKHIGFDEFGQIYVKEIDGKPSPLGEHSVSVYDLWNANLNAARQKEQERVGGDFKIATAFYKKFRGLSFDAAEEQAWKEDKLVEVTSGQTEYSQAVLDYINLQR